MNHDELRRHKFTNRLRSLLMLPSSLERVFMPNRNSNEPWLLRTHPPTLPGNPLTLQQSASAVQLLAALNRQISPPRHHNWRGLWF